MTVSRLLHGGWVGVTAPQQFGARRPDHRVTMIPPHDAHATPITGSDTTVSPVRQLRLVVEAEDFDEAVTFYRDVLGLPEEFYVESDGDARVMAMQAGRATLEIINHAQRRLIDDLEVGRQVSRNIRVAFEVSDVNHVTGTVAHSGIDLIAAPTETPWRSRNARFEAPAGLQITLFEELGHS
jgi:predicted enzyme related to lactoylglutathione lyase